MQDETPLAPLVFTALDGHFPAMSFLELIGLVLATLLIIGAVAWAILRADTRRDGRRKNRSGDSSGGGFWDAGDGGGDGGGGD